MDIEKTSKPEFYWLFLRHLSVNNSLGKWANESGLTNIQITLYGAYCRCDIHIHKDFGSFIYSPILTLQIYSMNTAGYAGITLFLMVEYSPQFHVLIGNLYFDQSEAEGQWRHDIEKLSTSLALCVDSPTQGPVMWRIGVSFIGNPVPNR